MADPVTTMILVDVALMAGSMAVTASQKMKGPRLSDTSVTLADYGTPIPRFWGKRRLNPQIFWAKPLHEKKHTTKTKGGKYTEYKYFGTWACLNVDHEIDDVSRIWFDKRLVYDRTGTGPISLAAVFGAGENSQIKLTDGTNMRIYLGTETQTPDPAIEAWCEDRYGANTCPAYRGSAYIVFENIPLEQVGNRIPQITVEAINNKTDIYPYDTIPAPVGGSLEGAAFSPDYLRLIQGNTTNIAIADIPTKSITFNADVGQTLANGVFGPMGITADAFYGFDTSNGHLYQSTFDGALTDLGHVSGPYAGVQAIGSGLFLTSYTGSQPCVYSGGIFTKGGLTGLAYISYFGDLDGNVWATAVDGSATYFYCLAGSRIGEEYVVATPFGGANPVCMVNPDGNIFAAVGSHVCLIDITSFTVLASNSTDSFTVSRSAMLSVQPGTASVWFDVREVSTTTLQILRTVTLGNFIPSDTTTGTKLYDPVHHALVVHSTSGPNAGKWIWLYIDRVGSDGVTLGTVVDDVSSWCGLTGQDTSALTQTVLGYSVTQGSGKDMISPLLEIHDVDVRPHDFGVQFVNRGSAPSGSTILTGAFVRDGDARYKVTIQQDTDLPKDVTINFADWDHDQQSNNVKSPRPAAVTSSNRSDTIDLSTYADTADSAQQKVDRYQRRLWNSRERTNCSLTAQYLAMEPGDVKTISLDGALRNVRLDKLTIGQAQLDCEFVRDETSFAAVNTATAGPSMDGRDSETIPVPGPTKGFVIDAPLIQDADNDINPVIYFAVGAYNTGVWPGATVNRGDHSVYDTLYQSFDSSGNSTWGFATSVLGTANANLWDRGNTLLVTVYGTLTSHTEAEINANPSLNLCALGQDNSWEYLQFTTATLTGTSGTGNTYTLSGFRRGRRGTEGNVGNHAAADQFILLSESVAVELGTDDIGDTMSFKAQTLGRDVDSGAAVTLTYDGNTLKPYAPAYVKWSYNGTDLTGTIIRRTRVGGTWNGSTISLGETSEAYEVDIYNGSTFKRTISVSGTNVFTYTGAMATADGITLPTPPTINAYQISSVVGRGFALAA